MTNDKCQKCKRPIDAEDDVVEVKNVKYHEECAPRPKVTVEELAAIVLHLRDEIQALKSQPKVAAVKKKSEKGRPRSDVWYEILGFPAADRPPQCMKVMRCLAQATPEDHKLTELQVWEALMGPDTTLGTWNYVQTPFHIFKFYRADMINAGYVKGPFQS